MKKVLTVLLAATGMLAFSACGGNNVRTPAAPPATDSSQSAPTTQAAPATQATTEAQAFVEVTIPVNNVTLTLPKGFQVYDDYPDERDNVTMFANPDERAVFYVVIEDKSLFEDNGTTPANDFLDLLRNQFKNDDKYNRISEIIAVKGVRYFEYEYTNGDKTFRYFTTAMESDNAYYTLQCFTPADEYDGYKDRIINWMQHISVK